MFSYFTSETDTSSDLKNCTIASTFLKAKSLKIELLFGDYVKEIMSENVASDLGNSIDYFFTPGQIFAIECMSISVGNNKFHYGFVLQACRPKEPGSKVMGISPGASILLKTLTGASTLRLKNILAMWREKNIRPTQLTGSDFKRLNNILETKLNYDFFVGEIMDRFREE